MGINNTQVERRRKSNSPEILTSRDLKSWFAEPALGWAGWLAGALPGDHNKTKPRPVNLRH
jgi:hypothetical protein